jgi:hypothetical protein
VTAPPLDWEAVQPAALAVVVWVDGLRFDLTVAGPQLMHALSTGDLSRVVPGAAPPEQAAAWYAQLLDPGAAFDVPDARAVADAVIAEFTGMPAETAMSLARFCTDNWLLLDGYHLRHGLDLLTLAPRRLLAVLYAFVVEHRFEGDRDKADRALFPQRMRAPTAAELAQDGRAFAAAMAMAGSMPGAGG